MTPIVTIVVFTTWTLLCYLGVSHGFKKLTKETSLPHFALFVIWLLYFSLAVGMLMNSIEQWILSLNL